MFKLFTFLILFFTNALAVAPNFQASGTAVDGTGNVTVSWPTHQANDVALLFVESTGDSTVAAPSGFTEILNSPQIVSTPSFFTTNNYTQLSVFWARATSTSMPAVTIVDSGNHNFAQILTYRNVATTGNPWDVTAGNTKSTRSTSVSVPAVTTTTNDILVVQAVSRDTDSDSAAFSNQTNALLTTISERTDTGTTSGDGGGFTVWDGGKATAGASGTTTATVSISRNAMLTIALKPINSGPVLHYTFDGCTIGQSITAISDVSGNGNNATGYNGLKCIATDRGTGAQFDGVNDYAKSNANYSFTYDAGYTVYSRFLIDSWTASRFWILYFGYPDSNPTCSNNGMHWLVNVGPHPTCGETLPLGTAQFGVFCGSQNQFVFTNSNLQTYVSVATVYDSPTKKLTTYMDGVKISEVTSATNPSSGSAPVYMGRPGTPWSCESSFKGIIDEVKIYPRTLSETEILQLFTGEGSFSAADEAYKTNFVNGKLNTKIASTPFNLRILARDANDFSVYKDANISKIEVITCNDTPCTDAATTTRVIDTKNYTAPNYLSVPIAQGYSAPVSFTFSAPYKNLRLRITGSVDNGQTFKTSISKDAFSIRPSSYSIAPTAIKAGELVNVSTAGGGGIYNGTANVNTTLRTNNPNCPTQNNFLSNTEPTSIVFNNDVNNSTLIGKDIGDINVTIYDQTWSAIDQISSDLTGNTWDCIKDSNTTTADGSSRIGCNVQATLPLTISPYELNTTRNSFHTPSSSPTPWLYLDSTRTQNVDINTTIRAYNKDGITVSKNFSDGCIGSAVPLGFYLTPTGTIPANVTVSLTSTTGSQNTISDINTSYATAFNSQYFSIPNTSFKNGDANLSLKFNFIRSDSNAINPFDLNLTSITTSYGSGVINNNALGLNDHASFLYGRTRAYDIKTDQPSAPIPIEFEVYSSTSTGYVSSMPQNILHWYRNLNHDTTAQGSVLRGGFSAGITDTHINVSTAPLDGLQNINVTSSTNQTVHLDISPWLWYSPTYNYNYNSDCTKHPCFDYQFIGVAASTTNGVNSGTFQGSDFTLTPAKTIIKKGVKVFR